MTVIKCTDQNLYPFRLRKWGRVKKIFWDRIGRAYFKRGDMRTYLDTVESLHYPYFYEDENGKYGVISGYEYIGACSPLYVEILNDGESVQLWDEV